MSLIKCIKCKEHASVFLRYANLRLCKKHFNEYILRRVKRTVNRYNLISEGDKVLVGVSGGKDSIALLNILEKLRKDIDFYLHGLTIDLGIGGYSKISIEKAIENYELLNIPYTIFSIKEYYGFTIRDLIYRFRRRSACSLCGVVKRYILNRFAYENGFTSIATGHNLDDMIQIAFSALLRGDNYQLAKVYPKTEGTNRFVTRIRPLAEVPEKDALLYVVLNNLPYVKEECPFSIGASSLKIKKIMNLFEDESPSIKLSFARNLYKNIVPLLSRELKTNEIKSCEKCGMPSRGIICSFCKLKLNIMKD